MTTLDTRSTTLVGADWASARTVAHGCLPPLAAEHVSVGHAHRRVLASDLVAATALPAFTSSAMDGWAVSGPGPWTVTGTLLAGGSAGPLAPGEAVVIATGAQAPGGATAVLRSEDGVVVDGRLEGHVRDGDHLRLAGEEAHRGELMAPAGVVLTAGHLGLAAAAGYDVVPVVRRPTVAVLVLGDELLDHGVSARGRVRDSLGPQLPAWLDLLGCSIRSVARVPDSLAALVEALISVGDVDLVVTTGGTAAGPVDLLHRAIEALAGRLVVDSVAVRPGHPMLLARLAHRVALLGLPGNPQAAVAALLTLGAPLVDALLGRPLAVLDQVRSREALAAPGRATRLVLARRGDAGAIAVAHQGSAMLRGLAEADGYLVVPTGGCAADDRLAWLPLPR
ncbi:molybdopterin molybdotransferase MoeA [Longivirga aurantiaca]|uniref:Molybdopterin molybdenumtransferase n=1 Tax=Longivirga aurantiaca TaxID=1837743 RepID=A0ABW1T5K5_9ACTN